MSDATLHYADNYTQLKIQWLAAPGIAIDNEAYYLEDHRHFRDVENYAYDPVAQLIDRSEYIEIYHTEYQAGDRLAATFTGNVFGFKNQALLGGDYNNIFFERTDNTPFDGSSTELVSGANPGYFMNVVPLGTHNEYETRTNTNSLFAEDHLDVTKQLALVAGVRLESDRIQRNDLVARTSIDKDFPLCDLPRGRRLHTDARSRILWTIRDWGRWPRQSYFVVGDQFAIQPVARDGRSSSV